MADHFANTQLSDHLDFIRKMELTEQQEKFLQALSYHPPGLDHYWKQFHGRKGSVWFCEPCGVPVALPPPEPPSLWERIKGWFA